MTMTYDLTRRLDNNPMTYGLWLLVKAASLGIGHGHWVANYHISIGMS